jgi:UDP-N-acetylglucosamine diphosphorylase / glucose-1-phosphate thymidylyltransferase / UDP-N-acetylgalactosamine diphosphorylase / glucosamine-1-phosphate N-acetyltransferase / galactosamine-1-phosphate N-acetyltransferase
MTFTAAELFDLTQTEHAVLFDGCQFAWEALPKLQPYLFGRPRQQPLPRFPGASIGEKVIIGEGTRVEPGAMIKGPAIIGRNCQIRHNAYIRENVLIGDDCVVGNASELKNAWLFNGAQVPHYNYVGDSILGHKAHLGAGVICSNLKSLPGNVIVQRPKSKGQSQDAGGSAAATLDVELETLDTGLRKFGALIGDGAEVGCNSVLNPGSIIGRGAIIYPGMNWRGFLPANNIAKNKAEVEVVVKRPRGE